MSTAALYDLATLCRGLLWVSELFLAFLYNLFSLPSTRLVQKLDRILNNEYAGSQIRVNVFGSSGNLLSSSDSDVDICITTPLKRLDMHALADLLYRRMSMAHVLRRKADHIANAQ